MRRLVALLIVLAMVLLPACRKEDRWQEQYELGRKYLSDGDYEEAILAFTLAIEIDPQQPKAYLYRGDAYIMAALDAMEDGDYDEAKDYLDLADDDYDRAEDLDYDEDKLEDRREELEELEDELREQENADKEDAEDAPQAEAQPEPTEEMALSLVTVSDAYTDMFEDETYGATFCYHIPRFEMEGDRAAQVNEMIYEEMMTILEEQVYAWDFPGIGEMVYTWGQTERIASVAIYTNIAYANWPTYYTYTIDKQTGTLLTLEEVLAVYGLDEDAFRTKVRESLMQYYEDWLAEIQSWDDTGSVDMEFFNEQKETTLSDDNMDLAVPYVDENGNLCVIIPIYNIAGPDYTYSRFCLEGASYETTPDYMACQIHNTYY